MSDDQHLPDIHAGLDSLGQTTTAAELVREKGQQRKLKVISERKLKEWMEALLRQAYAGRADSFSDQEKQRMLERTQEELARRIKREQAAESERDRLKAELDHAMEVVASARAQPHQDTSAALEAALSELRAKLEERDRINAELQDENYSLQDQLSEKVELVGATITEKDHLRTDLERLRTTLKQQMLHSNDLVAGVLGLDESCYGGKHQADEPQGEGDAAFYRDFSVGARVVSTLASDIQRLRDSVRQADEDRASTALLADDLAMVAEVKAGKASLGDVAQPVESLIEALDGARHEAESLEEALTSATGTGSQVYLPATPDSEAEPAKALADSTSLVRAMAAQLASAQRKIAALGQMSQSADEERNEREEELERLRAAFDRVAAGVGRAHVNAVPLTHAEQAHNEDAQQLADAQADLSARAEAANALVTDLARRIEAQEETIEQLKDAEEQRNALQAALAAAQRDTSRHERAASDVQAALATAQAGLTAAQAQRSSLEAALAAAQRDAARHERTTVEAQAAVAAGQAALSAAQTALAAAQRDAARHERTTVESQAAITALNTQRDSERVKAQEEANALRRQLAERESALSAAIAKAAAHAQGEGEAEIDRQRLEAELDEVRNQQLSDQAALSEARSQLVRAEEAAHLLAVTQSRLAEAEERLRRFENQTGAYRIQLQADADRADAAQAEAERLKTELARLRSELSESQATAASAHAAAAAVAAAVHAATDSEHRTQPHAAHVHAAPAPAVLAASLAPAVEALVARKEELQRRVAIAEQQAAASQAALSEARQQIDDVQRDQAEHAESAKEIISQLSQGRELKDREVKELRTQVDAERSRAATAEARAAAAENANRVLGESLSLIAAAEERRPIAFTAVEGALAQLPAEGESGIELTPDTTAALAESGKKLAEELVKVRREEGAKVNAATIAAAKEESSALRRQLDEQDAAMRRLRAEQASMSASLAEQAQSIGAARAQLASSAVERETLISERAAALQRAEAAEHKIRQVREQAAADVAHHRDRVSEVLRLMPAKPGDAALAALDRAEAAANGGDEQGASAMLAESLRLRVEDLSRSVQRSHGESQAARQESEQARAALAELRAAIAERDQRVQAALAEVAALRSAADSERRRGDAAAALASEREAALADLTAQLERAGDELADLRARREAKTGIQSEEVDRLRKGLTEAKTLIQGFALERTQFKQEMNAADVRLKRLRDELEERLSERDRQIQERDRLLDQKGDAGAENSGLRAQVSELEQRLAEATRRLGELEGMAHGTAGLAGRSGDLVKELRRVQEERDRLRNDMRRHEADLADARAQADELTARVEEKRREALSAMEQATAQVQEQLSSLEAARDEARRLREENAGLKARINRTERGRTGG